jgi:hypothetical protein
MMEADKNLTVINVKETMIETTEKTKITKIERKKNRNQPIEKMEFARKAIIEKSHEIEEKITKDLMKTHYLIKKTSP